MRATEKVRQAVSIRKGDMVRVMIGRDRDDFRGKEARVLSVDLVKGVVTVEHAHIIKRHTRPNPQKNIKGGIVEREGPIQISNVRLVCPGCHKPTRVGYHVEFDGTRVREKHRICRKCGASLER